MVALLRRHASTMLVAFVTAAVTAGGPAIAASIADYAKDADKVDGKHAVGAGTSVTNRAGKLVATNATTGRLPNNIIASALDLRCTGCVGATELDDSAATQAELDGVASTAADAWSTAHGAKNDLTALKQRLSGGTRLLSSFSSTTSTEAAKLKQFTVNVPASGTLTLVVTARYWFDAPAATSGSKFSYGALAVCDAANTFNQCGASWSDLTFEDADNAKTEVHFATRTLTRSDEVAAGPRVFHINGSTHTQNTDATLYVRDATVVAFWSPSGLGITSP